MKILARFHLLLHLSLILALLSMACNLPTLIRDIAQNLELFVSPTGNDENDCQTPERACQHIATAVQRVPENGIVRVAPGHYREIVWITKSMQLLAEEGAILDGERARHYPGLSSTSPLVIISREESSPIRFIKIENLTIQNGRITPGTDPLGTGIHVGGVSRLELENVTVQNCDGAGLLVLRFSGSVQIRNARFLNNGGAGIEIRDGGRVTLDNSLVEGNRDNGIVIDSGASLTMSNSTVHANRGREGGIANRGDATISGSTIYENVTTDSLGTGGGIKNYGRMTVINTTISGNQGSGFFHIPVSDDSFSTLIHVTSAQNSLFGVMIGQGPGPEGAFRLQNNLIVFNHEQDCYIAITTFEGAESFASGSRGNMDSDNTCSAPFAQRAAWDFNPLVGPLADNGGATLTHALLRGSPAIDALDCPAEITADQRGVPRPQGARCDVGAFEIEPSLGEPPLMPSATPLAIVASDATLTPSPTLPAVPAFIPSETPTPGRPLITFTQNANCRKGPSQLFSVVTAFEQDKQTEALGRNAENTWILVAIPDGGQCWVSVTLIAPIDLSTLPIQPTPIPPTFTPTPAMPPPPGQFGLSNTQCSPNGYMVILAWQDVNGENGYRIYRDGILIATLQANTTTYTDNPPFGGPYTYRLEAFNKAGASPSVQVQAPKCQY